MVYKSYFWKKPLLESADRLKQFQSLSEIDEETYIQIEKDIFIGFYSIRKLLDAETKVTDSLKKKKYQSEWYAHFGDSVTWKNNHKLNKLYDFSKTHQEERDLWFIASRIIHGFIFNIRVSEFGGLHGVLFTSDNDKNRKLYTLSIEKIIEIFREVGTNEVTKIYWHICPETSKEVTVAE